MRRAVAWLLGGLPFDARSRRAIDETLLDWEGEATEAQGFWEATGAEVHGVTSVLRVASLSAMREGLDVSWYRDVALRFALGVAALFLVTVALSVNTFAALDRRIIEMSLTLLPATLLMQLPPVLVLMIVWRPSAGTPALGAAVAAAVLAFGFAHWLMPAGYAAFRELAWQWHADEAAATGGPVVRGSGPAGAQEPPRLLFSLGWACLCGAGVLLASSVVRHRSLRSWWSIPALLVAFGVIVRFAPIPNHGATWLIAATVVAGASLMVRHVPALDTART